MKYKIVGDSCTDFGKEDLAKEYVFSAPLILTIGDVDIVDDETFDQEKMLNMMAECETAPRSACPSPEKYMAMYEGAEEVYVITLSSKLSGSYNSAVLARQMFLEEHPDTKIHVFDSFSAAAAQHLIYEKIEECLLNGMEFEEVVNEVSVYISKQRTLFVLEDLSVFEKNGRIPKVKAKIAGVLNIKAVLAGAEGEIVQLDQGRGMNKALNKMINIMDRPDYDKGRKVCISYCACPERAKNVRMVLMEKVGFKNVELIEARGVSTLYESRGGIVVSF